MKNGKAMGTDEIPVEAWTTKGGGIVMLWDLMQEIHPQEKVPVEMRESIVMIIYKAKGDVQDSANYRGIKLMFHKMKIWESVID